MSLIGWREIRVYWLLWKYTTCQSAIPSALRCEGLCTRVRADLAHVVVHSWEVVPVVEAGSYWQRDVHAQQVERVSAGLVVVLGDWNVEVLWWDFAAHGQQVQVAIHDQERADHATERGRREDHLVRVLWDPARLRLAHVVEKSLVSGQIR